MRLPLSASAVVGIVSNYLIRFKGFYKNFSKLFYFYRFYHVSPLYMAEKNIKPKALRRWKVARPHGDGGYIFLELLHVQQLKECLINIVKYFRNIVIC